MSIIILSNQNIMGGSFKKKSDNYVMAKFKIKYQYVIFLIQY